jgi:hypothetical protein
MHGPVVV